MLLLFSFEPSRECAIGAAALKVELRITFQDTRGSKLLAFDAVSAHGHAPASADQGATTEESHLALKTVCSALFRLLARVDAASRSAVLGGGGDKSDGEAKPFCCCFIHIPPTHPSSPAILHAVSRYPALISSALDMKGLQMQFDGFMLRIIHKQSTAQRGKLEPRNNSARAVSPTGTKRKVSTDVLVLYCSKFYTFWSILQELSR